MKHEADGSTCACIPGHRCLPCTHKKHLSSRLIRFGWRDDPDAPGARHERERMTWEQQIDARDRAWTARDLYDIWMDRDRYTQTWWRIHRPDYWNRQTPIRDWHVRPTSGQIIAWAKHHGRDVTVGERTSDAFPDGPDCRTCTQPLADCDEPTFIFARSLSPRLDSETLARPLTHFHRADESPDALVGEEELDLFTAAGVAP